MWDLVAAELPATPDNTQFYLLFAGGVVAAIASIAVAVITTRNRERTSPSPPPPVENGTNGNVRERTAVNEHRLDAVEQAHDEIESTVDFQDRRVNGIEHCQDQIVRFLDRQFPDWR